MNDPQWAHELTQSAPSKKYQRRVERSVSEHLGERTPDDLARKLLGGRDLINVDNIWGVLCHRLDQMPKMHDSELAHARAAHRRGEISQAQLDLVHGKERSKAELLGYSYRPE